MKRQTTAILAVVLLTCTSLVLCACGVDETTGTAAADAATLRRATLRRAEAHLRSVAGTPMARDWSGATLGQQVTPIYRPDVEGVAYYEVQVLPSGYIVVSTAGHDHPIAQWAGRGDAPTVQLRAKATRQGKTAARFYRLDALSYAAEDEAGELVAHLGELPKQITIGSTEGARRDDTVKTEWKPEVDSAGRVVGGQVVTRLARRGEDPRVVGRSRYDGQRFTTIKRFAPQMTLRPQLSWRELKASYAERFARQLAALSERAAPAWQLQHNADAAKLASEQTATARGDVASKRMGLYPLTPWIYGGDIEGGTIAQRAYDQLQPWTGPNPNSCSSGCGATAWAMMFGWADYLAAHESPAWSSHGGIYRQNGGYGDDVEAPWAQDAGVNNMTMELRARLGTFCMLNQGATLQIDMYKAVYYLVGRDYAGIRTNYNLFYMPDGGLLQNALNILLTKRPVIIGIGSGTSLHYALAYGFSYRHMSDGSTQIAFRVNWGDGASATEVWIPASTWFVGELVP